MKKFFTLLNLVFIYFIIHFLVSGLYGYFIREFEIEAYSQISESQPSITKSKKYKNQSYYKPIVRRDLFDTEKENTRGKKQPLAPEAAPDKKIKLTELKLELKGTITGTGSDPFAVIRKKGDKTEMLYAEGDTVDRARIKAILRERVILLVDGKEETLLMEKIKKRQKPGTKGYKKTAGYSSMGGGTPNVEEIVLKSEDVETFTRDLQALRKQIRVRPHFYKGKMDGFRITGIKSNSIFYKKLGLRNGDIISDVNDQEIRTANDAVRFYEVFTQLDGNATANVGIKRRGLPETIRYSIE